MPYPYADPNNYPQNYGMDLVKWHTEADLEDQAHAENKHRDQRDRASRAAAVGRSARAASRGGGRR